MKKTFQKINAFIDNFNSEISFELDTTKEISSQLHKLSNLQTLLQEYENRFLSLKDALNEEEEYSDKKIKTKIKIEFISNIGEK